MNKSYLDEAADMANGMNYGGSNASAGGFILYFNVNRLAANIASSLPVAMFAPSLSTDGYARYLADELGSNSITVFTSLFYANSQSNALLGDFFFTYSDGTNTDDVRVQLPEGSYKQFQSNLLVDKFKISEFIFSVPTTSDTAQFNEAVIFKGDSGYGSTKGNRFTPTMFKDSREQDTTRIHVNRFGRKLPMPTINRETGMIVKMRSQQLVYTIIVTAQGTQRM